MQTTGAEADSAEGVVVASAGDTVGAAIASTGWLAVLGVQSTEELPSAPLAQYPLPHWSPLGRPRCADPRRECIQFRFKDAKGVIESPE